MGSGIPSDCPFEGFVEELTVERGSSFRIEYSAHELAH